MKFFTVFCPRGCREARETERQVQGADRKRSLQWEKEHWEWTSHDHDQNERVMKAICECVYTTAMNNTPTDFKNAVSTDNSKFKPYLFSAIAVVALRSGIIGIFFFVMIVVTAPFRCRLLLRHRNEVGVQQVIPQRFRRRLLVLFSTLHAFGLLGRGILSKQLPSRTSFPTSRRHDVTVNVTIKTLQQQTLCKSQRAPPPRTASPATHGFNKNKRGWARLGEGRGGGKQHGSLLWLGRPAARRSGSSRRHSASARQLVCGRHGNKSVGKHTDGKLLLARCHNIVF